MVTKYQDLMIAECKNLIQNNEIKSRICWYKRKKESFFITDYFNLDLNLLFQLLDKVPNVDPLLADLEAYVINEGLMVMKANSETITSVRFKIEKN